MRQRLEFGRQDLYVVAAFGPGVPLAPRQSSRSLAYLTRSPLSPTLVSEEHNKRVFHQQMVETGSSLLFDGEYGGGGGGGGQAAYFPANDQFGAAAPYAQTYYPQQQQGGGIAGQQQQRGGYGRY